MIVGFIDPVGTVFQSAKALRKMTISTTNSANAWYSLRSFVNLFIMSVSFLQREGHIGRALDRIRIIRRNLLETQETIKPLRFLHRRQPIENDTMVSGLPRLANHRRGKHAPDTSPAAFRPHI